jgi:hypothetical protein
MTSTTRGRHAHYSTEDFETWAGWFLKTYHALDEDFLTYDIKVGDDCLALIAALFVVADRIDAVAVYTRDR